MRSIFYVALTLSYINLHATNSVFIVDLLSNTENYYKKEVSVLGYVDTKQDQLGLYLTREYAKAYRHDGMAQLPIKSNYQIDFSELPSQCKRGYLYITGVIKTKFGVPVLELTKDTLYLNEDGSKGFYCKHFKTSKASKQSVKDSS